MSPKAWLSEQNIPITVTSRHWLYNCEDESRKRPKMNYVAYLGAVPHIPSSPTNQLHNLG